jgi:hypothetical protein
MKKWLIIAVLFGTAAALFAGPVRHHPGMHRWADEDLDMVRAEIEGILAANGSRSLGDLTIDQVRDALGQISVARQKAAFIEHSKAMSFMLPGMGQFANRDPLAGSLFLTSDVLVVAGTLVGAYFLLPDELQFAHLNYFTAPYSTIETRWKNQSFVDMLPSLGVLAAGWLVDGGLRLFSSKHAGKLARRNVENGTITFEPEMFMMPFGPGGMGMGMQTKY